MYYFKIMNYVLVLDNNVPNELNHIIKNIKTNDSESKIYTLSPIQINVKNVINISFDKILAKEVLTKYQKNQIPKIFLFKEILSKEILSKFIHFDTDVLLLKSFNDTKHLIVKNKINLTNLQFSRFSFGYSYFDNHNVICQAVDLLDKLYSDSAQINKKLEKRNMELDMIKKVYRVAPEIFSLIPTLPFDSKLVFDPGSYGRYLLGQSFFKNKFLPGRYRYLDEEIGKEISSKRLKLKISDNNLEPIWNNHAFQLATIKSYFNPKLFKVN